MPTRFFKRLSIQNKMVLVFTLLAFSLFFVLGALFYNSTQEVVKKNTEDQLTLLARETANKVDRFLFERYGDIQVLALSPILYDTAIDKRLKKLHLDHVRKAYETYDYIAMLNLKGEVVVSSGNLEPDFDGLKWVTQMRPGVSVSDMMLDQRTQNHVLYFSAAVVNAEGKSVGIVVERMNTKSLGEIVENVQLGRSGQSYLLSSKTGTALFGATKRVSFSKETGIVYYTSENNENRVSARVAVKPYGTQHDQWQVVVEEPTSIAFEVAARLKNYMVLVFGVALMLLLVAATLLAREIARPIKQLMQSAQEIVAGGGKGKVEIEASDEIGRIAYAFNQLLEELNDMMQEVLVHSGEAASFKEIRDSVHKMFDEVPTAVVTLSHNGRVTGFNTTAAQITGLQPEEVVDKPVDVVFTNGLQALGDLFKWVMDEEQATYKKQIMLTPEGGTAMSVLASVTLQTDKNGKILGVIAVFRRQSSLQAFEASLLRAQSLAALGEMAAGVAHEIRNPLTAIRGYAQYASEELGTDHVIAADMRIILKEVDRLNGIIDRFLTFARPSEPRLEAMDCNQLVRGVIQMMEKEALNAGILLKTDLKELPIGYYDYEQLEQVLLNMILNGIQAMSEGGIIAVQTHLRENPSAIGIVVHDTGKGIAPALLEDIFQPFFTTKDRGTGLGLSICQRIVENHKGVIEVRSRYGRGTEFEIVLPL